jgi:hypothetical protein
MGGEVCTIFGALKKRIQNYEYTISYKSEYLERENKSQQIPRTSLKKADTNHTHHKIQKNKEIFVLNYYLTHVYSIQPTVAVIYWFYKLLKNMTL